MSDLTPVEGHVRAGEVLDPEAALVIRGWPLTVDGLLRNADATRRRYSRAGRRFVAVSAEVTMAGFLLAYGRRPTIRTFTPRRTDPHAGEFDVEIVVHDGGAASDWEAAAPAARRPSRAWARLRHRPRCTRLPPGR